MAVKALSYIGVNSDKFEDWSEYSQKYLGMQQMDRGKEILSFRMDDQKQRLTITGDKGDGLGFLGWEVDSKEDLQTFANKLEENKIVVNHGKTSFADKSLLINGRNLTNIGVFRKYIECFVENHSAINKDLMIMARQLEPSENGLPIQIYAFSNDKRWQNFEYIEPFMFIFYL